MSHDSKNSCKQSLYYLIKMKTGERKEKYRTSGHILLFQREFKLKVKNEPPQRMPQI